MVDEMKKIQADLRYDNMLAIPCIHRASGLAMLQKEDVNLHVQTYSINHIDACIITDPNTPWRLTGFMEDQRNNASMYLGVI